MRWLGAMVVVAALSMVAVAAGAQDPEPQPALAAGLSAGTMRWRGGLERQVLTAALAYQPHPWLTVLAAPTAVRMIPSDGPAASGPGDVPVSVGLNKQLRGTASPVLGAGLVVSLPVGSQSNAIGSGSVGWAVDAGAGVAPWERSLLYVSASRDVAGARAGEGASVRYTSLGLDGALALSSRFTATASLASDLTRSDSTAPLVRTAGGGFNLRLAGPLRLVADVALGVNQDSPQWLFSIGLGTAYSGLSPMGLNNPGQQLKNTFGRVVPKPKPAPPKAGPG